VQGRSRSGLRTRRVNDKREDENGSASASPALHAPLAKGVCSSLGTQKEVLLEFAYFTIYLAIVLTILHNFLFLMGSVNLWIIEYQESLVIKLLYWPFLLTSFLLITTLYMY